MANACIGCPMNSNERPKPSGYLLHILELDEIISVGFRTPLPIVEWKALALLKRKRAEAELKRLQRNKN